MTKNDSSKIDNSELSSEAGKTQIAKKKTYKKPDIKEHGKIEDLTKFGGSDRANDFFGRRF